MQANRFITKEDEIMLSLAGLYQSYGYNRFKMSRFEEYDFYLKYKSFLPENQFISFNDTDGKLLALKPDITLSIVKNASCNGCLAEKIYYNEKVYRANRATGDFKEISQIGLEWLGNISDYSLIEMTSLAAKSLKTIGKNWILDISHLGFINGLMDYLNIKEANKKIILQCMESKNIHAIREVAKQVDIDKRDIELIIGIMELKGDTKQILKQAEKLIKNEDMAYAINQLKTIVYALEDSKLYNNIRIDFSIVGDMNYYNGIIFSGYIEGIANSVLVGGRYDNLLKHMHKKDTQAMGFALSFDEISNIFVGNKEVEIDVQILDNIKNPKELYKVVEKLIAEGKTVITADVANLKYKDKQYLQNLDNQEVEKC